MDDIQRGNAKQFVFVAYACFFSNLRRNRNGGVRHRVGDNAHARFQAGFSDLLHRVFSRCQR